MRNKGSGHPQKTSSRSDRLIGRLVRAGSTLFLTELARVALFTFNGSTMVIGVEACSNVFELSKCEEED